jgi:hypothetical protein
MAQVESIISPEALPIFGQFFTTAEFLMECGNEYFIVPAPIDNMAEKTLVKSHRASFPPRTLYAMPCQKILEEENNDRMVL